jgi:type I restriction-modification system DNA methylase subunit
MEFFLSKGFTEENKYTVVLANPPFKGSIDKSDINDHLTVGMTKTELLFVERMMTLLQIGGKCGVIVPDGVLFGTSNAHKKLRYIHNVGEIKENGYDLSISKYKEIEYEEVAYGKPEIIMENIEGLEDQIKTNISELKGMLKQG